MESDSESDEPTDIKELLEEEMRQHMFGSGESKPTPSSDEQLLAASSNETGPCELAPVLPLVVPPQTGDALHPLAASGAGERQVLDQFEIGVHGSSILTANVAL